MDSRASVHPATPVASRHPEAESQPRLGGLIFLFWTFYGSITAALVAEQWNAPPQMYPEVLVFAFGGAYAWAAITLPLIRLAGRVRRSIRDFRAAVLMLALLAVTVGILMTGAIAVVTYFADGRLADVGLFGVFTQQFRMNLLAAFLIASAGVTRASLEDLAARREEAAALSVQLAEARLDGLRARLNPHFLFNTLNAVSALANEDPQRVQAMIAKLSDMLRYMLSESPAQEIPLTEELEVLGRYFDLMELRYGEWLQTSIDVDPEVGRAFVPNLILQPLAENAWKHGVGLSGEGWIRAGAYREGNVLVLTMENSGTGSGRVTNAQVDPLENGHGFGLRHTRERLLQHYGGEGTFALRPSAGGGMTAEIRVPFRTRPGRSSTNA